jgi:transposase
VAVPREHRRAKTDRLDTAGLKCAILGWLTGGRGKMAAIPTIAEEDARQPSREPDSLVGEPRPYRERHESGLGAARYPGLQS